MYFRVALDNNGEEIIMATLESNQENIEPSEKKLPPEVNNLLHYHCILLELASHMILFLD